MMIIKIHAKVGELLKEFFIVNPQNLVFNENEVEGGSGLTGLDGKKLSRVKMIIHYPNGMRLVVEETKEELLEIFNNGKDKTICTGSPK